MDIKEERVLPEGMPYSKLFGFLVPIIKQMDKKEVKVLEIGANDLVKKMFDHEVVSRISKYDPEKRIKYVGVSLGHEEGVEHVDFSRDDEVKEFLKKHKRFDIVISNDVFVPVGLKSKDSKYEKKLDKALEDIIKGKPVDPGIVEKYYEEQREIANKIHRNIHRALVDGGIAIHTIHVAKLHGRRIYTPPRSLFKVVNQGKDVIVAIKKRATHGR